MQTINKCDVIQQSCKKQWKKNARTYTRKIWISLLKTQKKHVERNRKRQLNPVKYTCSKKGHQLIQFVFASIFSSILIVGNNFKTTLLLHLITQKRSKNRNSHMDKVIGCCIQCAFHKNKNLFKLNENGSGACVWFELSLSTDNRLHASNQ